MQGCRSSLLQLVCSPLSAGVWFVCLDRRPSASLGGRTTTCGCHPHHDCHCSIHRVCQQYSHYYHLSACLGRAGKVAPWQGWLLLCSPALGWAGLCWDRHRAVLLLLGLRHFEIFGSNKASACSVTWTLEDNNPSDVVGKIRDYLSQSVE